MAALYAVAVILAWPALGLVVGTELARRVRRGEPMPVLGALVVGLIALHLVTHLPILGGLVEFLGLSFGLGLIVQSFRRGRRPTEPNAGGGASGRARVSSSARHHWPSTEVFFCWRRCAVMLCPLARSLFCSGSSFFVLTEPALSGS